MAFDKDYQELDLTWERGLVESVEDSMLPVGASARLRNWFADPSGNLRTRVGWLRGSEVSAPSTRVGSGVGHYAAQRRPIIVQEAEYVVPSAPSGTTLNMTPTWAQPTVSGNLLVACLSWSQGGQALNGNFATVTPPSGWVLARRASSLSAEVDYSWSAIYYKAGAASQSGVQTWVVSSSGGLNITGAMALYEVANAATSGVLDRTGRYNYAPGVSASTISLSSWADIVGTTASTSTDIISTQAAHGFAVDDAIRFTLIETGVMPAPLVESVTYYVYSVPTSTSFTVKSTLTSTTPINITGTGTTTTWYVGHYPRVQPVGIAFAVISQSDNTDNTITSASGYTLQQDAQAPHSSIPMNHYIYSKIYEASAAYPDVDATINAVGQNVTGVIANFKADNFQLTDSAFVYADDEGSTTTVYAIDADDIDGGTHTLIETITASSDSNPVAFASGNGYLFYTHPNFSAVHTWNGVVPAVLPESPPGRCLAWHKNRLWVGGTLSEPWKLFYSEFGDHTTWNAGSATFIEVGKGDGEAIEDITPFQDGLMIVKRTSAWFLTGGGPDTFRLIRLPLGGSAPGRSLAATPDGVVIAGTKNVYLFDGSSVGVISSPVRDSYEITGDWVSTDYVDQKVSICDQGTGNVWTMDFSNGGTWYEERINDTDEAPAFLYGHDDTQVYQPRNGTESPPLNYRLFPGSPYAKDYDDLTETFEAWTPELWPVGPEKKVTPRYLYLKTRQRGGDSTETPLSVACYYNSVLAMTKTITPRDTPSVFWTRLDIGSDTYGKSVSQVQFRLSQTLDSGETACFDIEEVTFGFNVEEVV